jgi:hypothetical protein
LLPKIWAARSFSVGYHMLRQVLDNIFPLKDETLYDDLEETDKL